MDHCHLNNQGRFPQNQPPSRINFPPFFSHKWSQKGPKKSQKVDWGFKNPIDYSTSFPGKSFEAAQFLFSTADSLGIPSQTLTSPSSPRTLHLWRPFWPGRLAPWIWRGSLWTASWLCGNQALWTQSLMSLKHLGLSRIQLNILEHTKDVWQHQPYDTLPSLSRTVNTIKLQMTTQNTFPYQSASISTTQHEATAWGNFSDPKWWGPCHPDRTAKSVVPVCSYSLNMYSVFQQFFSFSQLNQKMGLSESRVP